MAGSLRIAVLLLCSLVAFPVMARDVDGTQVPDTEDVLEALRDVVDRKHV